MSSKITISLLRVTKPVVLAMTITDGRDIVIVMNNAEKARSIATKKGGSALRNDCCLAATAVELWEDRRPKKTVSST